MMTPEQIRELATLSTRVGHIVEALDEVRDTIKALPALLAEFARARDVENLRDELRTVRAELEDLKRGSPARVWELLIKGASGVGILWGLVVLVRDALHIGQK